MHGVEQASSTRRWCAAKQTVLLLRYWQSPPICMFPGEPRDAQESHFDFELHICSKTDLPQGTNHNGKSGSHMLGKTKSCILTCTYAWFAASLYKQPCMTPLHLLCSKDGGS